MGVDGRIGMSGDFQNVVASHGPGEVEDVATAVGVVNFLSVGEDEAFTGCDGPDECDVVFFSAAFCSCAPGGQCVLVGESKSPLVGDKMVLDNF